MLASGLCAVTNESHSPQSSPDSCYRFSDQVSLSPKKERESDREPPRFCCRARTGGCSRCSYMYQVGLVFRTGIAAHPRPHSHRVRSTGTGYLATETCPQTGLDAALKPQTARIQDPTVGHAYTLLQCPRPAFTILYEHSAAPYESTLDRLVLPLSPPLPLHGWPTTVQASMDLSCPSNSAPHRQLEPLIHSVPESAPPAWMLCAGRYQQIAWLTAWRTSHLLRVHVLHCGLTASPQEIKGRISIHGQCRWSFVYEYSKLDLDNTHCPNTVQITTYGRSYRHSTKCEITDRSSLGPRICRPDLNWAPSWLLAHSSSPTNGINDHLTASFSRLVRRRYVRLLVRDLLLTNSVPILQAMPPRFWHLVPSTPRTWSISLHGEISPSSARKLGQFRLSVRLGIFWSGAWGAVEMSTS
ncbi:hypothetical protein M431DRAFT_541662 [Trichoderma harzianum CBS 226.95]|uniref:Uncharacterized protein n=1 Tax=Trichoderma harzianum CBS 226.95 TaxID=983964 RepID=A0A2T3ZZ02_TRIHA|nr:hypothetical protein M431DRAFT_541662 [Trichoderma harzianum CBS 226.95]PTB50046.1 hypothetical protein M431DRAFT_541662 [Trichoderma harzianum CBS 226.95]